MEELTLDYLPDNPDIKLFQHKKMFRINTDSCKLGEFLEFDMNLKVLDIGTNNGVLLLYASKFSPSFMLGIDINEDALGIAKQNMEYNQINATLLYKDAKEYASSDKFDVIISNPPYFANNKYLKNENNYLAMARHEEYLSLDDLIQCVVRNLKEDGSFFLIHLANREKEIIDLLTKYHFGIKRKRYLFDINKKDANSLLLQVIKCYNGETKEDKQIIMR